MTLQPFYPAAASGSPYLYEPSGQTSGVRDTATINSIIQNGQQAQLVGGTYYLNAELLADSYGSIMGIGGGTILQAVSGDSPAMFGLLHPATTKQVLVANVTFQCNQVTAGIVLDNTGFVPATSFVPYDPLHVLDNVFVLAALGDAFHFDNNQRELRCRGCKQYFASGYGFYLGNGPAASGTGCTDSHFSDCTSGQSGNHGFFIGTGSGNNMFTGDKTFFSGFLESTGLWDTTSNGWEVQGNFNAFAGCWAQQAALHGWDFNGCTGITAAAIGADTCNAGGAGGVAVNTSGVTNSSIGLAAGGNNGGLSPGNQLYGTQVAGTQTGLSLYGNSARGSDGQFNYLSGYGYQLIESDQVSLNSVGLFQSPSQILYENSAAQALVNAATISTQSATLGANYALLPVSSTLAVTGLILQPSTLGTQQVTVLNTTGFTLTFAAAGTSHVADGVTDVIPANTARTFTWDAITSLWYRTA
jgi:hypothetical protein